MQNGYTDFVSIPSIGFDSANGALRSVAAGKADAIIDNQFAMIAGVKKMNLEGILTPRLYKVFSACFLVARTEQGDSIDQHITDALTTLDPNSSHGILFGDGSPQINASIEHMKSLERSDSKSK